MMKPILSWLLSYRVGQLRYLVAKTYLGALFEIRRSALIVFGIIFFIALFTSGIMLVTFGIAMVAPVSTQGRGVIVLSMGLIAVATSSAGYIIFNSERMWIRVLRVNSILKAISGK